MFNKILLLIVINLSVFLSAWAQALPPGFVYLRDIDPSIIQEIRYAGYHNFVGRPIQGYIAAECILTHQAAKALANVQQELRKQHHSLKVYDCYRPTRAVSDFITWSRHPPDQAMKPEFYPRVNKRDFFKLGYVATRSGHSRGSTVDLTIVNLAEQQQAHYQPGQKLTACYAARAQRFADNSIDMGTGYDCLDKTAHVHAPSISAYALENRLYLQRLMQRHGFNPLAIEWWHFTLQSEPFPETYFDFPIMEQVSSESLDTPS